MFSLKKADKGGPAKRPERTAFGSFEEHEEQEEQPVAVVGFDKVKGAKVADESKVKEPEPIIVTPKSNENWMDTVKRRVYIPEKTQGQVNETEYEEEKLKYGLNPVVDTKNREADNDDDYEELPQLTEQEAYQKDIDSRPDAPDMEAYSRVPVEEFGAALLRGMGVKERTSSGSEQIARRPAMLGIGAKHVPHQVNELGSWGKGESKQASKREQKAYVPVAMVNKKTGKRVTDSDEENVEGSSSDSRSRYKERERRRDSERDRYRDRNRDRHRDRDRDSERHRNRESDRERDKDRRYKRDDRHRRRSRSPRR
ncbi:hypothetical protein TRICI_004680 [Trichomonascus ciferrii]|uniref:Pre-mRNA-splicing factor n=1 Tax=Trichomonascus ciferrii TaxID=44093 RepID=A0A642V0B5_9ASCO|nr:hypothetical protein TRICI_004680 [Trichomonascus ciferrii]